MAMNTALKVVLGTGVALGLGYAVTKAVKKKPTKKKGKNGNGKKKKTTDVSAIAGAYSEGATLDPGVFEDFHPDLQAVGAPDEYLISVTPGDPQLLAYEYMLHLVANKGLNILGKTADKEEAVVLTLNQIAPDADFSQGLQPYVYESPHWYLWNGVSTLGELAHINLDAKGVLEDPASAASIAIA